MAKKTIRQAKSLGPKKSNALDIWQLSLELELAARYLSARLILNRPVM
jgi:hypothetical protein